MSDLRKAAQELLDSWDTMPFSFHPAAHRFEKLRAALAQPEQEPAKKPCRSPYCECAVGACTHPGFYDARGSQPEQRKPLTEEEVVASMRRTGLSIITNKELAIAMKAARAIEKAHGIGGEHE